MLLVHVGHGHVAFATHVIIRAVESVLCYRGEDIIRRRKHEKSAYTTIYYRET